MFIVRRRWPHIESCFVHIILVPEHWAVSRNTAFIADDHILRSSPFLHAIEPWADDGKQKWGRRNASKPVILHLVILFLARAQLLVLHGQLDQQPWQSAPLWQI